MATAIVDQARQGLRHLEELVTSVHALSALSITTDGADIQHLAYLYHHLATRLHDDFQAFHVVISQQVLPLVADVKVTRLVPR